MSSRITRSFGYLGLSTVLLLSVACGTTPAPTSAPAASPTVAAKPSPVATPPAAKASAATIAKGGKLYDAWWKVTSGAAAPTGNSPLWSQQTTNTRTGVDTWRCKECHGWDYKGKDGAYGSGSHKTGFPGVIGASTSKTKEQLVSILKGSANPNHNFSTQLGDDGVSSLADFLKEGVTDVSKYIDQATKKPIGGDATKGQQLYEKNCVGCHGADGTTIKFGSADAPEYVGTIASDNPWEFFHKVRFGQPGAAMPNALESGWTIQDVVDMLAYSQSLKTK